MEALRQTTVISVEDASQVSVARRAANELAERVGFDETLRGKVEIATVELANNLQRYAQRGQILLNAFDDQHSLEILSIDHGPGMANTTECLRDGYTTGSTPGLGLGAVQRMAARMDIFSTLGKGTVISALFSPKERAPVLPGVVCVAYPGESYCGDRWATKSHEARNLYLMVDGLGHGLFAAQAAELAVDVFLNSNTDSPTELMDSLHQALRSTRGAAALVLSIDPERHKIFSCGVGNISASLHGTAANGQHIVSHNGTVGHQLRRTQGFDYTYQSDDLLVLHSDGISTHWNMSGSSNLRLASPSVVASVLYRDCSRGRDDASVLVTRLG